MPGAFALAEAASDAEGVSTLVAVAIVAGLGVGGQWLGARLGVPSILILLATGILSGPVLGWVDPDLLLGDLLFPAVSLGVGVLLFDGGLALRREEVQEVGPALLRLVTIGALVTWVVATATIWYLFDLDRLLYAALIGAVLVVSGPTVVMPLLRQVNVRPNSASLLKWEGILIDPIGALLAVVVLEAVLGAGSAGEISLRIFLTLGIGGLIGWAGQWLLSEALHRHWVPDRLHNAVVFMAVVVVFVIANEVQSEGGLMATTVMGVTMANQRRTPVGHIVQFQEDIGVLVLGALFILLGARVDIDAVIEFLPRSLILLGVLVFVARPLAVWASTVGSSVPTQDRLFVSSMMPRGIVAAAVASLFALELEDHGEELVQLVPVVFTIIIGSVVVYGLLAGTMARVARVARARATGVALVGGADWVLDLAEKLGAMDVPVLVVTSDDDEVFEAISRGLLVYAGRLESDDLVVAVEGVGVETAIAISESDDRNDLALLRFVEIVGRANMFVLPAEDHHEMVVTEQNAAGRRPFGPEVTRQTIRDELKAGSSIRRVVHNPNRFKRWLPLLIVDSEGSARVVTDDVELMAGETALGFVLADTSQTV